MGEFSICDVFHSIYGSYSFSWCSLMSHQWLAGASKIWFLSPLVINSVVFENFLKYIKNIKIYSSLFYNYVVPDLELATYLRIPGSFSGEWYFENIFWLISVPFASGLVMVSRLFQWINLRKIWFNNKKKTNLWVHIDISNSNSDNKGFT